MEDTLSTRRIALAHQPFHGVLDLSTGQSLTLHQFIGEGDYGDLIQNKRLALEHDLLEDKVRYVCQRCRKPMVLRSKPMDKEREDRFYLKHRFRSEECGGTKGMTHDAICAMVYANTKESEAHRAYKALIVASLTADPTFTNTQTEATWFGLDGVRWRKPDVQTTHGTQRIALEVQLSTTFVEVVAQRQAFYRKNVGNLIWFFRDLAIGAFRQAEDDIFFNNNRNAFLVNEDRRSLRSSRSSSRKKSSAGLGKPHAASVPRRGRVRAENVDTGPISVGGWGMNLASMAGDPEGPPTQAVRRRGDRLRPDPSARH